MKEEGRREYFVPMKHCHCFSLVKVYIEDLDIFYPFMTLCESRLKKILSVDTILL